ncbi:hypothetical protein GGR92_005281 [Spirosoma lacussanchae]|uniref:hypothetical protein n=1 Tax=Spirosoma lacussanchae TaxID=1884249 RepID=UPI001109BBDD|nr:hypothetical protein [Spirosoma lacussanchae]
MTDEFYPTVSVEFIRELIENSGYMVDTVQAGPSVAYMLRGQRDVGKRTILISLEEDTVNYDYAVSIAYRTKTLTPLMEWLEQNRNWKSGGYFQ